MTALKQIRERMGISQAEAARRIGISRQAYSNYELGKRQADYETLLKLAETFSCSVEELLGKTPPNYAISVSDLTARFDNILPITRKRFPMLGEIACGKPIFAQEDRESYVMADMDINADFCLRAKGDSMTGARIFDGDIVFIREMPIVDNGEIAAVIIGDEATLKRVYYYPEKGKLILNPENPAFEPLVFLGDELNEIRILGKAVYFMSAL